MKFDLLIKNGRLVLVDEIIHGAIGITKGKISALLTDDTEATAKEYLDAQNNYILPGLVDVNIHMRVPGQEHKEDFFTGTSAAAAGGVTTILDMPNTNPPITTIDRLHEKKELVKGMAVIDYAFHFQGSMNNLEQLKKLESVPSVKFFMAGHETTPTTVNDIGLLYKAFSILSAKKIVATVHAENQSLINALMERYKDRTDFKAYSDARNSAVCETAVSEIICIARETKCHAHICHVSTAREVKAIKRAKEDGVKITCEAVPYHLFLTQNDCERLGSFSKVSPALKTLNDQESLWAALKDGTIDCITSEHTPHTLEEKNNSVWKAPAGCPGVQEMLPLLVDKGMLLSDIAKLCSENPAKIFGLKNKGKIQVGYDADLVILDPEQKWTVKRKDLFSKCGWSSYEGLTLKGIPIKTLVRGNIVYEKGKIMTPNIGEWIY
ncbi:dihydroorotase [Candidatus Magnetomorum sp. HK-1]|nr:dihydroorotase [Candidatus Magnetomorum sp. HK-1]